MFPFTRKPDAHPDEQTSQQTAPTPTPEEAPGVSTDPLRRHDLTSPGLRGLAEKALLGAAPSGRVMGVLAVIATFGVAVYFGYAHWVGFDENADFFNPGLALMVFGAHLARSFLPRTAGQPLHTGYSIVHAMQTAVVLYIVFVIATQPLDRDSLLFLVSYGAFALVSMLIGFITTTRIRRSTRMLAEEKPDDDALRRALHMDR